MARFIGGFFLVSAPWYLVVYTFTGNPVFPFLNVIFKSPLWPLENTMMNLAKFGLGKSFTALISLPLAITYQTKYFDETLLPGGMGLAILVAVPFCFGIWRTYRAVYLYLGFTVVVYSVIWALSAQYVRYYMPAYAILTLLSTITPHLWPIA
ncbi:hypothetical protein ACFL27_18095 [candidate division CSSED10-310 bacterium]|uniref:Glycosyltransferase RgtA/B/C/D-like domain-containing protein n=1 Tax=candidate division CSSED10-310 bacterium TaxID=2855610 RepID=A0ABV6Z0Z1_UNCC1